jgi:hypothetical protein
MAYEYGCRIYFRNMSKVAHNNYAQRPKNKIDNNAFLDLGAS